MSTATATVADSLTAVELAVLDHFAPYRVNGTRARTVRDFAGRVVSDVARGTDFEYGEVWSALDELAARELVVITRPELDRFGDRRVELAPALETAAAAIYDAMTPNDPSAELDKITLTGPNWGSGTLPLDRPEYRVKAIRELADGRELARVWTVQTCRHCGMKVASDAPGEHFERYAHEPVTD